MRTNLISLHLDRLSYGALKELTLSVLSGMSTSSYYSSPSPSLADLSALLLTYSDAMTARGDVHNHGSTAETTALRIARKALEGGLKELQAFCVHKTPGNLLAFQSVNWPTFKSGSPVGVLGPVNNFRQMFQKNVIQGWVKLRWNKPDGMQTVRIPMFIVKRSSTKNFSDAEEIARVTRMEYIDKTVGTDTFFYWVIPVNAYGDGAVSGVCVARSSQVTS